MRCKCWPSATILLVVVVALSVTGALSRADDRGPATVGELAIDLSTFAPQRATVEAELARDQSGKYKRAELLGSLARSSFVAGRFDIGAAAAAMFLDEVGAADLGSELMFLTLIDCLAPLDLDSHGISHTDRGPVFEPRWRSAEPASRASLLSAARVCDTAAEALKPGETRGTVLLRQGWILRALDDWDASTRAWDRCAATATRTRQVVDALWLAAENQEALGNARGAAERMQRIARDHVGDARAATARARATALEREAKRDSAWLRDPVRGVQDEIASAKGTGVAAESVFESALNWAVRREHHEARLALDRWGVNQADWSATIRVRAWTDLAAALTSHGGVTGAALQEAAQAEEEAAALLPAGREASILALRASQLWVRAGDTARARALLTKLAARPDTHIGEDLRSHCRQAEALLEGGRADDALSLVRQIEATCTWGSKRSESGNNGAAAAQEGR